MSWELNTGHAKKGTDLTTEVANLQMDGEPTDHVLEQIELAKNIAQEILQSGAVGGADAHYVVHLAGHANPDHTPQEDSAAFDELRVTVRQVALAETEPPAGEGAAPPPSTPGDVTGGGQEPPAPPAEGEPGTEPPAEEGAEANEGAGGAAAGEPPAPDAPDAGQGATPPPDTAQQGEGTRTPPPASSAGDAS